MIGYFPVLDELLKRLLNKFRDTPEVVLPATDLETEGITKAEVEAEFAAAATSAMLMIFMLEPLFVLKIENYACYCSQTILLGSAVCCSVLSLGSCPAFSSPEHVIDSESVIPHSLTHHSSLLFEPTVRNTRKVNGG